MRRQLEEEHDNKERWLVSYADFITLLFAFFVVMYSISSVNEGKYKVLSQTLEGVFNAPQKSIKPIQIGDITPRSVNSDSREIHLQPMVNDSSEVNTNLPKSDEPDAQDVQLEMIAGEFEDQFEDLIFEEKVSVQKKDDWIEISLDDTVVFQSGGVEPVDEKQPCH